MELIKIEKTDLSPLVLLDPDNWTIKMNGECLPEDARGFFTPVLDWIQKLFENKPKKLELDLNLPYFNSSTSKQLLKMFYLLEELSESGVVVNVVWNHLTDDDMILEKGEEFDQMTDLEFKFKQI